MGAQLTPDELAGAAMRPRYQQLTPVIDYEAALRRFLAEELPPDTIFDAEHLNLGLRLVIEFNRDIWQHRVPSTWEMVLADRAGRLEEHIAEIEAEYQRSKEKK
ncbi:hypothetical protein PBI_ARCHERS7_61 [Mycobacterium phage ArcherS7]|uniref:Uncharacterized protein n=11 Tax=Bixzunavirus TaxID=680114 RepID=Q853L5_BPMBZ|nr:gp62 [Mycobacterium phage Bxz1]YP_008061320.1 hypothetical protein M180_gp062 [Mycobacterium phage ArcherS7]YP_009221193.1 hypothetical protein AWH68_gp063 [Mycobacterium phage Breeniome]YP_010058385.1 hypothetical protein KHO64_gp061 [Mycobacterium phage Quasimodo]AEJ94923.1 hypothetical protein GHOST_61 [Mycobacterium phage Ghost]AEK06865.1 hypothetical protein DRAZDYS_61 [Mycobacterium phage Drazdys]AER49580.1 hypothetical protein PIO_66 [Mycobacterium phage Pio]AKG94627.1 hypothetical